VAEKKERRKSRRRDMRVCLCPEKREGMKEGKGKFGIRPFWKKKNVVDN